jgi:hypothetical protein
MGAGYAEGCLGGIADGVYPSYMSAPSNRSDVSGGMVGAPNHEQRARLLERARSRPSLLADFPSFRDELVALATGVDAAVTTRDFGDSEAWELRFDHDRMERVIALLVRRHALPAIEITCAAIWNDWDPQRTPQLRVWKNRVPTPAVQIAADVSPESLRRALSFILQEVNALSVADLNDQPLGSSPPTSDTGGA